LSTTKKERKKEKTETELCWIGKKFPRRLSVSNTWWSVSHCQGLGMEMEILPLPITPCHLVAKFLLLVLLMLCSAGLEVLGFGCCFVFLFVYTRD
jgi:cell shape-determining protein MreD